MRFLLLFADAHDPQGRSWEDFSEEEKQTWFDAYAGFTEAVRERGTILAHEGLAPVSTAKTVRGDVVTDGPYAETVEQLGGFVLIEVPDEDTALELAKLGPADFIEVRACVDG